MEPLSAQPYFVRDALHGGLAVYAVTPPTGWNAWSEVRWELTHTAQPVTVRCELRDPTGARTITHWPIASLYWVVPELGMVRPGAMRNGQVCMPPTSAGELLARWILPQVRGHLPGFAITEVRPSPELPQRFQMQAWDAQPEGVTARVFYEESGALFEEEFVAVKVLRTCPTSGPFGGATQINWGFERIASFRAPRGRLDPARETFWRVNDTVRINPEWLTLSQSVAQQLNSQYQGAIIQRYEEMQQAQQAHDAEMQQRAAAHEASQRRFEARMAAPTSAGAAPMDRNEAFRDLLGGERTYHDDFYAEAQQSKHAAGWEYVFTDGQGNYRYSNDPNYDPNVGSSQTWVPMRERR